MKQTGNCTDSNSWYPTKYENSQAKQCGTLIQAGFLVLILQLVSRLKEQKLFSIYNSWNITSKSKRQTVCVLVLIGSELVKAQKMSKSVACAIVCAREMHRL